MSSCMSYSCTNIDCFSCSLTSTVCSICNSGFTRDDLYQCSNSTSNINSTNANSSQENNANLSNQSISSYSPNYYSSSLFFFFDIQWIYDLLAFLIELVKNIIDVPTARKIVTPLFYYFSNFDDLYLYSLHNREYSDAMNSLFQQIANIENKKWTLLSF